ncbi:hypothetical protein EKO27_g1430 [Xylaria grammica]|uniref:40S ribosomal protein S21 n=1 Tax=Xylaria grammica TaxID=363999 RepID=A0A439DH04_9PEZI|nr:hypothetical protein EKO27_g1430 [Xylaria grammica]
MENDRGEVVDLYVPRKCSATGRQPTVVYVLKTCVYGWKTATDRHSTVIKATDHASVQISVARLDDNGRQVPGENHVYALSGFVRAMGEGDDAFNRITQKDGLLKSVWSANR